MLILLESVCDNTGSVSMYILYMSLPSTSCQLYSGDVVFFWRIVFVHSNMQIYVNVICLDYMYQ